MKKNTIIKYCASLAMGLALCSGLEATAYLGYELEIIASGLNGPSGISTDGLGNLYFSEENTNDIKSTSVNGGATTMVASGLSTVRGVWADNSGNVYFCEYGNSDIKKVSVSSGTVSTIATGLSSIFQLWGDNLGSLYYTKLSGNVASVSTSGGSSSTILSGLSTPNGIYGDGNGFLYCIEESSHDLRKISIANGHSSILVSGLTAPRGVAVDNSGNVYFSDIGTNTIKMLQAGMTSPVTIADGLSSPYMLCVDGAGNIYCAQQSNNTICKLLVPTTLTVDVEGTNSATHSGTLTAGIVYKTNAGSVALSGANAIGNLDIQGGKVSVSSASNLNGSSSAVTFAASGTDPVTAAANTATLEIAGTMNTGAFAFSTAGTVQVDGANVATLNAAPTGTGLVHKTGSGVMKVASNLSSSTTLAGIHVDAGTLYVQSGKAPVAPIQIANGAALQLAGVDDSAESEVTSALTVQAGGSIVVDANVEVGRALAVTTTYTFDTADGYYKNGAARIAWPSNFVRFNSDLYGADPWYSVWNTNDTSDHGVSYGGITLWHYPGTEFGGTPIYYSGDPILAAAHPTTSVSTGMDAALSGTVLMESGSSIVYGAGSTWARDITVGTPS